MTRSCRQIVLRIACLLAIPLFGAPALAADLYAGKTIDILVGSSPLGSYDAYARAIARHLGRHIPGNPTIAVKNMPGASSARAAAYINSVAPNDGTVLGAIYPDTLLDPLLNDRTEYQFDPTKFAYLGSADNLTRVCVTYHTSKTKTFDDALKLRTVIGAGPPGSVTRDYATLHRRTSRARFEIVSVYKTPADILLAMERGEVDGVCGIDWMVVKRLKRSWLREGRLNLLVQAGVDELPELSAMNVPTMWKHIADEDDRKAAELIVSQQVFGRPYVAPPGISAEAISILRSAFNATLRDPKFLADAAKSDIDINPVEGVKIQELIARLFAAPQDVIEHAKDVLR
jgi:tripartite-type tricarboxylate transporter receptor subunit TctC